MSTLLQRQNNPISGGTVAVVLLAVIAIAALYFGREVLVPIALAVLLSFVLAPFVRFLQRWYAPRVVAVLSVTLLALVIAVGLAGLMVAQVNQLANDLPRYESTLREKIQSLRGVFAGTGTLERASEMLKGLQKEIERSEKLSPGYTPSTEQSSANRPIPVEVRQPDPGALQTLVALVTPLIFPLTTTGVVFIFVVFILFQRQDLRNRLIRLAGAGDIRRTTAALDEAGTRLSRLFLMQLALNAAFGLVIGVGLWFIGVPSAPLWGMMAMILRFVPYVGALIAAVFPLLLAAAVDPGWTMVLWTAALFLLVEPLVGHVIEPMLFGHSAGLSPVAVVAAATFWTWLWGPIGLILATPLTICLVVLGRHVERLKFLDVMFGDEPALTPAELIYQRMLARDPVEATEQAWLFLREKPVIAYYDEILLEGLKLAQADAERDRLDNDSLQSIRDVVTEIVDDLRVHQDEPASEENANEQLPLAQAENKAVANQKQTFSERWGTGTPVLCIPGVGVLDEAAGIVLAQLLERCGIGARPEQADALSISRFFSLDMGGIALICLCYLERASDAQIRYAIRRVRRAAPDANILLILLREDKDREHELANARVAQGSFAAAVENVLAIANEEALPARGYADHSSHAAIG
jgi:predicted PurR-regulated permease PerM